MFNEERIIDLRKVGYNTLNEATIMDWGLRMKIIRQRTWNVSILCIRSLHNLTLTKDTEALVLSYNSRKEYLHLSIHFLLLMVCLQARVRQSRICFNLMPSSPFLNLLIWHATYYVIIAPHTVFLSSGTHICIAFSFPLERSSESGIPDSIRRQRRWRCT